jgi:predicted lipid-binding transport protein (Tim44 family)
MPGAGIRRRVCFLKVGFAILGLGLCLGVLTGGRAGAAAIPDLPDFRAQASPWQAGPTWSLQRHAGYTSAAPIPAQKPSSHTTGYRNLWKFLAGGLLGGLLGSLLFGYPLGLSWGPWPFGFLDLVAFSTIVYMGYRLLRKEKPGAGMAIPGFHLPEKIAPPVFTIKNEAGPGLVKISQADPGFDLAAFVEFARRVAFDLHEAWNHEDLDRIKDRVTERMLGFLGMGLKIISLRGEISRMEDLSLSGIVVTMAGKRRDREIIKISFVGRVVDYMLERRSFKLISGSMSYPERFDEYWLFERKRGQDHWLLADIHDSRVMPDHEAA